MNSFYTLAPSSHRNVLLADSSRVSNPKTATARHTQAHLGSPKETLRPRILLIDMTVHLPKVDDLQQ